MIKRFSIIFFILVAGVVGAKPKQMQMPPTVVKTMRPQQKIWQKIITETGSLSAFNGVMLASEVPGRITKIYFQSGQYIKKGTPLIQLFAGIVKAQLAKAEAVFKESRTSYQRQLRLFKKGFVTRAELDKARSLFDADKAEADNYRAQVQEHLICAPFSGNLGLRKVSLGDYINAGEDLVSLQSVDPMRIDFSIPQRYLGAIKVGDKVTISSQAFAKEYTGEVYALDAVVDQDTRMLSLRAKVQNPQHILVPGAFVSVKTKIKHAHKVLVIPATAVVYGASYNYVFRALNNKAVQTTIELGAMLPNNEIIVTKGLTAKDDVIVEGQMKLFNGAPIILVPPIKK